MDLISFMGQGWWCVFGLFCFVLFLRASFYDRKCQDVLFFPNTWETQILQAETPATLKDLGCILQCKSPKCQMTVRLENMLPLMSVCKRGMHRIPPQSSF